MPYIPVLERSETWKRMLPTTAGELNYLITMVCQRYLDHHGRNYGNYNNVVGVLESAKLEMYRRQIAKYEDAKIEENGDVYIV